jgi:hypothetical protein
MRNHQFMRAGDGIAVARLFRGGVFAQITRKIPASEEAGYSNWRCHLRMQTEQFDY